MFIIISIIIIVAVAVYIVTSSVVKFGDDDNDTVDDPIDTVALGMLFVVVPFDDLFAS